MIAVIRSSAALTVYKFDAEINYKDRKGVMTRDDNKKSFLIDSTKISTFTTSEDFLIIGCMECDFNKGWIKLYTTDTLRLKHTVKGSDKNKLVGKHVETKRNLFGMNQLWYSSHNNDFMFLTTLIAFKNVKTATWEFDEQK